ncbi:MAG: LysR family transcriptional regulator [Granulosicoccus sp.]
MNETNLDWDDLRLFLAVAREGGLASAAEKTGKSAPTLGRRMLALEKHLGNELFNRLPRGYVLTEEGQELLARVASVEDDIYPIINTANTNTTQRVKISAGTWVTHLLCENVVKLAGPIPVVLQFISADHVLDIGHREAIIGIRNRQPEQITLAGRPINRIRFAQYAADEHVKTWARVIGHTPSSDWVKNNIKPAHSIEVTSPRNALDLALSGAAKTLLPTFIGNTTEGLIQVSDEIPELEHMQWLVTHHEDRHSPEVRQVIDNIFSTLKTVDF